MYGSSAGPTHRGCTLPGPSPHEHSSLSRSLGLGLCATSGLPGRHSLTPRQAERSSREHRQTAAEARGRTVGRLDGHRLGCVASGPGRRPRGAVISPGSSSRHRAGAASRSQLRLQLPGSDSFSKSSPEWSRAFLLNRAAFQRCSLKGTPREDGPSAVSTVSTVRWCGRAAACPHCTCGEEINSSSSSVKFK